MTEEPVRVDIVSDVVCPWCIVGYQQLSAASEQTGIEIAPYWHPFELNTEMPAEGQNLQEHIIGKYGSTKKQSQNARIQLTEVGQSLGITFNWSDESRIYNTFDAHQLLHWASESGATHKLKLALFKAYFEDGQDVSNAEVLLEVCKDLTLDTIEAEQVLTQQTFASLVREKERFWTSRGVSGVPTMIFAGKHATSGAQGIETFSNILQTISVG
ncbi:DsbA family oxidoreductase [Shimia sp.]|uniref:DsbA family oxidoreductase n=1 Tax=Shimia sp. TaxID=1954381 RepID=UPI003B8B80A7